jgi:WhiB family redox-sensing transcriptional regulator
MTADLAPAPTVETTPWPQRAACRDVDTELFYPAPGCRQQESRAKAICALCPVAASCLGYALERGDCHGIWGALNGPERRSMTEPSMADAVYSRRVLAAVSTYQRQGGSLAVLAEAAGVPTTAAYRALHMVRVVPHLVPHVVSGALALSVACRVAYGVMATNHTPDDHPDPTNPTSERTTTP